MTTITYKNSIIAYDSRAIMGSVIIDDDREKMRIDGGVVYFLTGNVSDYKAMICNYREKDNKEKCDSAALVVDDGMIYYTGIDADTKDFFSCIVEKDKTYAIGSGQDFAFTAMDMGATAKEAVKWAMKRDTGTGGRIRTYKL